MILYILPFNQDLIPIILLQSSLLNTSPLLSTWTSYDPDSLKNTRMLLILKTNVSISNICMSFIYYLKYLLTLNIQIIDISILEQLSHIWLFCRLLLGFHLKLSLALTLCHRFDPMFLANMIQWQVPLILFLTGDLTLLNVDRKPPVSLRYQATPTQPLIFIFLSHLTFNYLHIRKLVLKVVTFKFILLYPLTINNNASNF